MIFYRLKQCKVTRNMLKTKETGFKNQMITDNEPVIQLRRKSYHVIKVLNIISIDD